MYKTMKVFDCQNGMAKTVKEVFFEENSGRSNNCYVSREVRSPSWLDDDNTEYPCEDYSIVDAWLLETGAYVGEYVLISHWW